MSFYPSESLKLDFQFLRNSFRSFDWMLSLLRAGLSPWSGLSVSWERFADFLSLENSFNSLKWSFSLMRAFLRPWSRFSVSWKLFWATEVDFESFDCVFQSLKWICWISRALLNFWDWLLSNLCERFKSLFKALSLFHDNINLQLTWKLLLQNILNKKLTSNKPQLPIYLEHSKTNYSDNLSSPSPSSTPKPHNRPPSFISSSH